jgi:hypothetical protein
MTMISISVSKPICRADGPEGLVGVRRFVLSLQSHYAFE